MTDTNKNTGEEYSFYQLIKRFSIEIPIIQRDYAQGRDSKEEIRENLLEDLYKAIDIKSLHLDFVYGSKKEDNGNIKFIPLDGQQRLTTLFLLHWYLANKDEKLDELKSVFLNENKSKFTYETRISSRDFCTELVLKGISIPFDAESKISDTIKNASWFFLSWEKDPTIKSMLVMLDAIHNRFKNANGFFDKLINPNIYESPITFQFLPLDKFGLTDNLYIKMNARGKPLTDFENFKAKFEQHLKEKKYDLAFISSFTHKMDCEWTDMFWSYKENYLIDNQFMNFFRVIATNTFALKNLPAKQNEVISLLRDNSKKMPISFYIKLNCFDSKGIKDIEQTLDSLKNGTSKIKAYLLDNKLVDELKLFEKVIKNNLSYEESIIFYALYQFIIHNNSTLEKPNLINWIRIIRNLTENYIYNRPDDYASSIKSIAKLLLQGNNILTYFANPSSPISGFGNEQIEEERIKALLILKEKKWEDAIIDIENYGFFKGQIGFILKFSGIKKYYDDHQKNIDWSEQENESFLNLFLNYSIKAKLLFSGNGLAINENYIVQRALLCKGDYLLQKGLNHSFLTNSLDRAISWKRLLRDDTKNRDFVKELLDEINSRESVKYDLNKIISESQIEDWRKYFIQYPDIIKVCGWESLIRWNDENNILLLNTTTTSGYHCEYYSYALFLRLKKDGNIVSYHPDKSVDYKKYISHINGKAIQISYVFYDNKWCYRILSKNEILYLDNQDLVVDYLKNSKYWINKIPVLKNIEV